MDHDLSFVLLFGFPLLCLSYSKFNFGSFFFVVAQISCLELEKSSLVLNLVNAHGMFILLLDSLCLSSHLSSSPTGFAYDWPPLASVRTIRIAFWFIRALGFSARIFVSFGHSKSFKSYRFVTIFSSSFFMLSIRQSHYLIAQSDHREMRRRDLGGQSARRAPNLIIIFFVFLCG